MSIFKDQWDFMQLGGQTAVLRADMDIDLVDGAVKQLMLYSKLVAEEAEEFAEATLEEFEGDIMADIKEAVDVIVVAAGYLVTRLGHDGAQKAWNLVHETNLAKVRGGAEKREDGKILQNKEYKEKLKAKLMDDLAELLQ